ncbi:MAG: MBL fold metallo-hydrolase [Desulfobacter sp.]|nr:MBL fold metallo-hydrolase [Desulfobacter sp.]WDP85086.1 MAG: MBL fold metallo-hydrolase [Desulfobacter sp.]
MKIHHLRNATFVIESGEHFILIDPMLSNTGGLPPFAFFRHKPLRNPIVPLPENALDLLDKISLCFITHSQKWGIQALTHTDHLDLPGIVFLRKNKIPVVCHHKDAPYLRKHQIRVAAATEYWQPLDLSMGRVVAVPAKHGHGWYHNLMANGSGFYLELEKEPSMYISSDTVFTREVARALDEFKPDISVVAAGGASMDIGGPILMTLDEIVSFVQKAPGRVIANHMDALNHCPITRSKLIRCLTQKKLLKKTWIPGDGETIQVIEG